MKSAFYYILLNFPLFASGQAKWPSPEIGQMYKNANEHIERGDYKNAVTICKQAILLAPDIPLFTNQLSNAYFLSGNYTEAEKTLKTINPINCDTQCFRLLASSQAAQSKLKQAEKTISTGIDRFPLAGSLYFEKGQIYKLDLKNDEALNAWLEGIEKDPGFAPDYYKVAINSMNPDMAVWGLLYGEIFLNMNHDTADDPAIKDKMFDGYKALFAELANNSSDKKVTTRKKQQLPEFQDDVMKTYTVLTPVISDGITTENLVMLRTRFVMDWFAKYSKIYTFPLFNYLDELIGSGQFDIYNQWLFGAAENKLQYEAWNKFHEGDVARFLSWKVSHPFIPASFPYHKSRMN